VPRDGAAGGEARGRGGVSPGTAERAVASIGGSVAGCGNRSIGRKVRALLVYVPGPKENGISKAASACGEGVRTPGLELLNNAQGNVIGEQAQETGVAQAARIDHAAQVRSMAHVVESRSTFSLDVLGISRFGET